MKLSMITCTGTGTIGGYTVTKETTMKQIDTAQLDITACQAQAAEYHARGFYCAQAVACTLAPAVGLDPQTAFTLTEGFGAGMGGMTETCGAISGAVAIMGFVMSDGMENPKTKGQTYKLSREIAKRFGEKNTTTVCGTLKGIGSDKGPLRSCPGCIDDAVEIACDVLKAARRVNGSNSKTTAGALWIHPKARRPSPLELGKLGSADLDLLAPRHKLAHLNAKRLLLPRLKHKMKCHGIREIGIRNLGTRILRQTKHLLILRIGHMHVNRHDACHLNDLPCLLSRSHRRLRRRGIGAHQAAGSQQRATKIARHYAANIFELRAAQHLSVGIPLVRLGSPSSLWRSRPSTKIHAGTLCRAS